MLEKFQMTRAETFPDHMMPWHPPPLCNDLETDTRERGDESGLETV